MIYTFIDSTHEGLIYSNETNIQNEFEKIFFDTNINDYVLNQFKEFECTPPFFKLSNTTPSYQTKIKVVDSFPSIIISWNNKQESNIICRKEPPLKHLDLHPKPENVTLIQTSWWTSNLFKIISKKSSTALTAPKQSDSFSQSATLKIMPNYGYHPKVYFEMKTRPKDVILFHHHTRNSFSDPFELGRIFFDALSVDTYGYVDLENPSHSPNSQNHFVVSIFRCEGRQNDENTLFGIELPFHLRYHRVMPNTPFVSLNLPLPYVIHMIDGKSTQF